MAWMTLRPELRHRPPVIETLFENKNVKIDRVRARGQITPPGEFAPEPSYEFILLLEGQLVLEYDGEPEKRDLRPGDYAIKSPNQKTRADYTAEDEETVYLKVSYRGEHGRYPHFTGAVGPEEVHPK
jgi:quercetin dioxygenase-like cupin family protein